MDEISNNIAKVYLWSDNSVTVFNEKGERLNDFEGDLRDVKEYILYNSGDDTEFYLSSWQEATNKRITRKEFEAAE